MNTSPAVATDILIFGGGIAGLWTLHRLRRAGFAACLLESSSLGSTQSIGSQGIIHGGIKYALLGEVGSASQAIAAMPERWATAMQGQGEVDLREASILSPCTFIWTAAGLVSRLAGVAASKVLRTPVVSIDRDHWPAAFHGAPKGTTVYRVGEPVLDSSSVLRVLVEGSKGAVRRYDVSRPILAQPRDGRALVTVHGPRGPVTISARHVLLTAGASNPAIAAALAPLSPPRVGMQIRPLHMVMARGPLPPLFGHALGMSSTPRLTITSARLHDDWVWYIGGQIAEAGVDRAAPEQIAAARAELAACLPWIQQDRLRWACVKWERAEGLTESGARPDDSVLATSPLVSIGWPSKLALAPQLSDRVLAHVGRLGIGPRGSSGQGVQIADLPEAHVAPRPWQGDHVPWTPA